MRKIAVIIYGPAGSGKSTQADLIAEKYGLIRFDVGKHIASILRDPANRKNAYIQKQKKRYDAGLLVERDWAFKLFASALEKIFASGYGVVIAGSPRAADEAFDIPGRKGIFTMLIKNYGKKNIHVFVLDVPSKHSIKRNKNRKLCVVCGHQYIFRNGTLLSTCPFCGALLRTRRDDNANIIRARLLEYRNKTRAVFPGVKKLGIPMRKVSGEQPPYKVFEKISRWLS